MRSALAAMAALLVFCLCGVGTAIRTINAPKEQILYRQETVYGDAAAADGLSVDLGVHLDRHLLWDSHITLDEQTIRSDTESRFSQEEYYRKSNRPAGVTFREGLDYTGKLILEQAFEDLRDTMETGSTITRQVRFADYCSYYPLMAEIQLPGLHYSSFCLLNPGESPETDAINRLNAFFQIPVLKNQYYEVSYTCGASDFYGISNSELGDSFFPYANGVVGNNACYFCFSNRTSHGNTVDTSLIPGGYGIYKLPFGQVDAEHYKGADIYHGLDVFADKLSVCYPLDPAVEYRALGISADRTRLLLHTVEAGQYYVSVIQAETGTLLQRIPIPTADTDFWELVEGEDFSVLRFWDRTIVLARQEDGAYSIVINAPLTEFELQDDSMWWYSWDRGSLSFDGKRLAVVKSDLLMNAAGSILDDGSGFCVAVYGEDQLEYYGIYYSSLEDANHYSENYFHTNVRPHDNQAISAYWR